MSAKPPEEGGAKAPGKKKPSHKDFIFGKLIGEGSYSSVYLAKEVDTNKEFAIKVLEKSHISREKKTEYVFREKSVFTKIQNHPFFIHLCSTFQDTDRLYFVLSYAKRGELLDYIKKLGCLDEKCTRFYVAEIILALDHLLSLKIVHRDLKPENILLDEKMHINITDFGSAKLMDAPAAPDKSDKPTIRRKNSFVGTAQYVSPEVLKNKTACYESDLWALGCIIYQLLSGQMPFYGGHEYQIFQKILNLEYEFPEGFNALAKDLVKKLLVLDAYERLGSEKTGGRAALKKHEFFGDFDWADVHLQEPPTMVPYLPPVDETDEPLWSSKHPGFDPGVDLPDFGQPITPILSEGEEAAIRQKKLDEQKQNNKFHQFVEGNLIVKQGLLWKRKGLFARCRMFLMTEGPHLYYVDPQAMVLKGQIPWSKELRPETKKFKIFFVHTPNRTYYLEDPDGNALVWCTAIEKHYTRYYGKREENQLKQDS